MDQTCLICRGRETEPLYKGLLRCRNCQYIFADLKLTDEELARLYDESLFKEGEFFDYAADRKYFEKNFRLRYKVLRRYLDSNRHRRLLEIGSAYGFFLNVVRVDFSEILGIDLTDEGVRYSREELKLPAVQGDFLQHNFDGKKFDVVCMWDTIEHVRRPDLYVEKVAELTEPGALFALTTGDIASLLARARGQNWRMIIPPVHAHYFSSATLTRLLENYGFEVVYNRYCGFYRSASNVAYILLALRQQRPRAFQWLQRRGLLNWGFYLNVYDIMYVIARKR
ncbi:MAG TPA: class I SAM-dependent methyltransferase [Pyrinomonadaceae bacterium]|nr:class I SAM-dependent methyltransferase [Pyrinomonadaceae bacterium]